MPAPSFGTAVSEVFDLGTGSAPVVCRVYCPTGTVVTGGGWAEVNADGSDRETVINSAVVATRPTPDGDGWEVLDAGGGQQRYLKVWARYYG